MTRIRIDDLPVAENLTPEQEELIQGAGLKSFRLSLESLEGREVPALIAPGIDLTDRVMTFSQTNSATVWTNKANQVVAQRGNDAAVFLDKSQVTRIVYQGGVGIDTFRNYSGVPSEFRGENQAEGDVYHQGVANESIPVSQGFQLTGVGQRLDDVVVDGQRLANVVVGGQRLGNVVVDGQRLGNVVVGGQRLGDVVVGETRLDEAVVGGQRLDGVMVGGQRLVDVVVRAELPESSASGATAVDGRQIGNNIHPPLAWRNLPGGTLSQVAVMKDTTPDRTRTPPGHVGDYVHSVIYNIPRLTREIRGTADGGLEGVDRAGKRTFFIAAGATSDPVTRTQMGVDDFGNSGYNGPNPRNGQPHTYVWTLYALNTERVQLPEGQTGTAAEVERAIQNNIIGQTSIQSTFTMPPGPQTEVP
jgi:Raf kinase inhibitor-like YbhB/YbcL family protein